MYGDWCAITTTSSFCQSILILSLFQFRYFSIEQANLGLKIGTDAMLLGAFIDSEFKKNGLDLGTGSGVLSLMQAQKN